VSDYTTGDRVDHERYGLGTVCNVTVTGAKLLVNWDDPRGGRGETAVLACNVEPSTARQ